MGRHIHKRRVWARANIQNVYRADSTRHRKISNDPIKDGQKTWMDISPKKTYGWAKDIWKDSQHHESTEESKLKPPWDVTSRLSEWLLSRRRKDKCRRGRGERGTLEHCKWVRPPWETVRRVLRKLNLELSYDPVVALLGIYPTKSKIVIRKDRRAPVFTVACTAATRGSDLRAHRQTIRYREASRTWTCDGMPHVESDLAICDTRVETELSEISQTGKDECHVIPLTCGKLKNNNNAETNS